MLRPIAARPRPIPAPSWHLSSWAQRRISLRILPPHPPPKKNEGPRSPGTLSPLLISACAELSCGGGNPKSLKPFYSTIPPNFSTISPKRSNNRNALAALFEI